MLKLCTIVRTQEHSEMEQAAIVVEKLQRYNGRFARTGAQNSWWQARETATVDSKSRRRFQLRHKDVSNSSDRSARDWRLRCSVAGGESKTKKSDSVCAYVCIYARAYILKI